jgi:colicin import membrane protein
MAKPKQKQAVPPKEEALPAGTEESPVALCLAKRLRACRKKLRKIEDVEAAVAAGKEINEEQRQVLAESRKAGLIAVIDELEKLAAPVKEALTEEVKLIKQSGYDEAMAQFKKQEEARRAKEAKQAEEKAAADAAAAADEEAKRKQLEAQSKRDKAIITEPEEPKVDPKVEVKETLTKVLNFLYFAQVRWHNVVQQQQGSATNGCLFCP